MRKFIKGIFFLLPVPVIIAAVNYSVDPASLFKRGQEERKIAEYLIDGKNIANFSSYHERLIQKYYIDSVRDKIDVIVLGSSRSMLIGKNLFAKKKFFNSSVDGATFEDIIAIYWMYRKKNICPSTVIIGLDPWILNKNCGLTQYLTIESEYRQAYSYINGNPGSYVSNELSAKFKRSLDIFSPVYFQISLGELIKRAGNAKKERKFYVTANSVEKDALVKLSDGTESFSARDRNLTAEQVGLKAVEYANQLKAYGLADFRDINQKTLGNIIKFTAALNRDGVEIIFFLCPYHPRTYAAFANSDKYRIIKDVEMTFLKLAKDKKIKIVGSYDPAVCHLKESDFYDGMHPKEDAIEKIFNQNSIK